MLHTCFLANNLLTKSRVYYNDLRKNVTCVFLPSLSEQTYAAYLGSVWGAGSSFVWNMVSNLMAKCHLRLGARKIRISMKTRRPIFKAWTMIAMIVTWVVTIYYIYIISNFLWVNWLTFLKQRPGQDDWWRWWCVQHVPWRQMSPLRIFMLAWTHDTGRTRSYSTLFLVTKQTCIHIYNYIYA